MNFNKNLCPLIQIEPPLDTTPVQFPKERFGRRGYKLPLYPELPFEYALQLHQALSLKEGELFDAAKQIILNMVGCQLCTLANHTCCPTVLPDPDFYSHPETSGVIIATQTLVPHGLNTSQRPAKGNDLPKCQ